MFNLSVVSDSATPQTVAYRASLSSTISWSSLKLMPEELEIPSNHLILCRPLLLPPSIFPSIIVFSSESALCIRWKKYWSFGFSASPSNEYSEFISFRVDWFDLAIQGTLKSLLQRQFESTDSSALSPLYDAALTPSMHEYWGNVALTTWAFVGKVMPLLSNTLPRFFIAFAPRSKCL